jgi:hypothetical protein
MSTMRATAATNPGPANAAKPGSAGAPTTAALTLAGFAFLAVIAPPFYAILIFVLFNKNSSNDPAFIDEWLAASIAWIFSSLFATIYPAVKGKVWAVKAIRMMSIIALILYFAMLTGDISLYFIYPKTERGFSEAFFCFPLGPFLIAAGFLIEGLVNEAWLDPKASPEQIGPSRGTVGDYNKQAGMDATGHLSPEKLEGGAAAPPPPRWLCYAAPPLAAARMRRWWHCAIFAPLCLATIALAVFIPIRAIFVYALMGTFTDRLRSVEAYRKAYAEAQSAEPAPPITSPSPPKTRRRTAPK